MTMPGSQGGVSTSDPKLSFILTMHERRQQETADPILEIRDSCVGNAVLVARRLAITAVHCIADFKTNLWVRSVLTGKMVKVLALVWTRGGQDYFYVMGDPPESFPPVREDCWAEDVVGLFLESSMDCNGADIPPVEESSQDGVEELEEALPELVAIAAANGNLSAVTFTTFEPQFRINDSVIAAVSGPVMGYMLESGAAVLSWGKEVPGYVLLGLQVSAPEPPPVRLPLPGTRPIVGLIVFCQKQRGKIERWKSIKDCDLPSALVQKPDVDARTYYIQSSVSGRVISGARDLVVLTDLDFFHAKQWVLHAVCSRSGLLTSGGMLWTRRLGRSNEVVLQINTLQKRESAEVTLRPGSALAIGGFLWLQGETSFQGKSYLVYLHRAVDDEYECEDKGRKRICRRARVRIAVFDREGPHLADRPEYNRIKFEVRLLGDDDRVQDDVGNGHEGYEPP
jgi:hypothetical protein